MKLAVLGHEIEVTEKIAKPQFAEEYKMLEIAMSSDAELQWYQVWNALVKTLPMNHSIIQNFENGLEGGRFTIEDTLYMRINGESV